MKKEVEVYVVIFIVAALIVMTLLMFQDAHGQPGAFQCADCELMAKTENSVNENYDEIYLHPWQTITALYIKAGNACYGTMGTCYHIIEGGYGWSFVRVIRGEEGRDNPNCPGISHIEVCYEEDPTDTPAPSDTPVEVPSETPTESPTATNTPDQEPTVTDTPADEDDPTPTWTDAPDTETPTPRPTPTRCVPVSCGSG